MPQYGTGVRTDPLSLSGNYMRMVPGPRLPVGELPFGQARQPYGVQAPGGPRMNHAYGGIVDYKPQPTNLGERTKQAAAAYIGWQAGRRGVGKGKPPPQNPPPQLAIGPGTSNASGVPATLNPSSTIDPSPPEDRSIMEYNPRTLNYPDAIDVNSTVKKKPSTNSEQGTLSPTASAWHASQVPMPNNQTVAVGANAAGSSLNATGINTVKGTGESPLAFSDRLLGREEPSSTDIVHNPYVSKTHRRNDPNRKNYAAGINVKNPRPPGSAIYGR